MRCSTRSIDRSVVFCVADQANPGAIVWCANELNTGSLERHLDCLKCSYLARRYAFHYLHAL